MLYVCSQLSADGQTCIAYTEFTYLSHLAITKSQMIEIGSALYPIAGLFIAYAIIAKAVNSL